MNRREFLKTAAVTGATLALPGLLMPDGSMAAAEKPDMIVATGPSPARITRAAVDAFGGMRRFVSRGDVVVIKPNIGWDRTPEYAATTNPEVVGALVRLCFEAGAKKVKVFDHTVSSPRRAYKQSGIADAAGAAGADVSFVEDRKFKEMKIQGETLKSWPLYTEVFEADKIINVPIAKVHGTSILTLGMKNWMGVMGGSRGRIHQRIDPCLVDMARTVRPTLVVLDAVRILVANGPTGGDLSDVRLLNTVVVGQDQVAVDAFGSTLFGLKEDALGCVRLGHQAGLGNMRLSRQKIRRIRA
ncbi:MAG TPA: DUF362 domain-containing protein [Syntrophales bacterium]|nr:DUF362 domain-containing protein [Syntrophales bacterium]